MKKTSLITLPAIQLSMMISPSALLVDRKVHCQRMGGKSGLSDTTAEGKVAISRRHLLDKVPVSDLCEELGLRPTVFYRWQKDGWTAALKKTPHASG
jgi:hypothetical protein